MIDPVSLPPPLKLERTPEVRRKVDFCHRRPTSGFGEDGAARSTQSLGQVRLGNFALHLPFLLLLLRKSARFEFCPIIMSSRRLRTSVPFRVPRVACLRSSFLP